MAPRRWMLVIVSGALVAGLSVGSANAQCNGEPTNHRMRFNDMGDLSTSPSAGADLLRSWVQGGFGSFRIYSWGMSPSVRSGSQRALGAVLRERRGLLR